MHRANIFSTSGIIVSAAVALTGCTIYPVVGAYYINDSAHDATLESNQIVIEESAEESLQITSSADTTMPSAPNVSAPSDPDLITGSIPKSGTPEISQIDTVTVPDYDYRALSQIIKLDDPNLTGQIITGSTEEVHGEPIVTGTPQTRHRADDEPTTWSIRLQRNRGADNAETTTKQLFAQ